MPPLIDPAVTFPLERPHIRRRRRQRRPIVADTSLPYFLCGSENRLLGYAATADASVLRIGNPIVLIGPTGVGKTAIAMHLAARAGIERGIDFGLDGPSETVYIPGSDYVRDYAAAIDARNLPSLQKRLVDAPVLILDDVEGLSDKFAAAGELARRLDDRIAAGSVTILTARRPIDQLSAIDSALASRVMSGLVIPLVPPDASTRRRLIDELAIALGVDLSPSCSEFIDRSLPNPSTSRTIESVIRNLHLHVTMHGRPVDMEMIAEVIGKTPLRAVVTMEKIVRVVGRHFAIATSDLRGPSRRKTTVLARAVAMWLSRKLIDTSTHKIGDHFGGRDHTTVMHALAKIDAALPIDGDLQNAIHKMEDKLLH